MAGKCLRRLSLLTLFSLVVLLVAIPANATQGAPSTTGADTELLYPAITLDKAAGPFTVAQALGEGTGPASGPGHVPAIGTGLLIAGLVGVTAARWRRRTA
jgi:hypothetical protein